MAFKFFVLPFRSFYFGKAYSSCSLSEKRRVSLWQKAKNNKAFFGRESIFVSNVLNKCFLRLYFFIPFIITSLLELKTWPRFSLLVKNVLINGEYKSYLKLLHWYEQPWWLAKLRVNIVWKQADSRCSPHLWQILKLAILWIFMI